MISYTNDDKWMNKGTNLILSWVRVWGLFQNTASFVIQYIILAT